MPKLGKLVLAAVIISGATLWATETIAASVCYKVTSGGNSNGNIYRLDIQRHSLLTSFAESGRNVQTAYSVHGKVVPFANAMGTVTGTVVVARGEGARLGIHRNSVSLGGTYAVLDCSTGEATGTPRSWPSCSAMVIRAGQDPVIVSGVRLDRVHAHQEPLCAEFRAGN